jgi:hypothetical protein
MPEYVSLRKVLGPYLLQVTFFSPFSDFCIAAI